MGDGLRIGRGVHGRRRREVGGGSGGGEEKDDSRLVVGRHSADWAGAMSLAMDATAKEAVATGDCQMCIDICVSM